LTTKELFKKILYSNNVSGHTIIQGEKGCGKSMGIIMYQALFNFVVAAKMAH
jgi:hypothetical protein